MEYTRLLRRSVVVARHIMRSCGDQHFEGRVRYVVEQCRRLAVVQGYETDIPDCGPATTALDLVEANVSSILSYETTGPDIVRQEKGLWTRLMTDWPVGVYAEMTAQLLRSIAKLDGRVLELGAGIGATTRLLCNELSSDFTRTDVDVELLKRSVAPGRAMAYDFNKPGNWKELDTVFAVCSLHCAANKVQTLKYIRKMMRPGGIIVLGEGEPKTDNSGTPWALNPLFGLFDGWWNVSGFVARREWLAHLTAAGFKVGDVIVWRESGHDLGGVIWAYA